MKKGHLIVLLVYNYDILLLMYEFMWFGPPHIKNLGPSLELFWIWVGPLEAIIQVSIRFLHKVIALIMFHSNVVFDFWALCLC